MRFIMICVAKYCLCRHGIWMPWHDFCHFSFKSCISKLSWNKKRLNHKFGIVDWFNIKNKSDRTQDDLQLIILFRNTRQEGPAAVNQISIFQTKTDLATLTYETTQTSYKQKMIQVLAISKNLLHAMWHPQCCFCQIRLTKAQAVT